MPELWHLEKKKESCTGLTVVTILPEIFLVLFIWFQGHNTNFLSFVTLYLVLKEIFLICLASNYIYPSSRKFVWCPSFYPC